MQRYTGPHSALPNKVVISHVGWGKDAVRLDHCLGDLAMLTELFKDFDRKFTKGKAQADTRTAPASLAAHS